MTESDPTPEGDETPEYAPTPFDGPYFVPVLLLGMSLWFAYDGFLNPARLDPNESLSNYLAFNQWGAVILAVAGFVLGVRAWRRRRDA